MIPRVHSGKSLSGKDLPKESKGCCTYFCTSIQIEGNLASLIASWPTLSRTQQQALLTLVQPSTAIASEPRDGSPEPSSLSPHDELFSGSDWQRLTAHFSLSGRQAEILSLLLHGESDKQIARKLGIAFPTVRTHLQNIYARAGVSDRTSLVVELFRHARTLLS